MSHVIINVTHCSGDAPPPHHELRASAAAANARSHAAHTSLSVTSAAAAAGGADTEQRSTPSTSREPRVRAADTERAAQQRHCADWSRLDAGWAALQIFVDAVEIVDIQTHNFVSLKMDQFKVLCFTTLAEGEVRALNNKPMPLRSLRAAPFA